MAAEKICFKDYVDCKDDKMLSKTRKKINRKRKDGSSKNVYGWAGYGPAPNLSGAPAGGGNSGLGTAGGDGGAAGGAGGGVGESYQLAEPSNSRQINNVYDYGRRGMKFLDYLNQEDEEDYDPEMDDMDAEDFDSEDFDSEDPDDEFGDDEMDDDLDDDTDKLIRALSDEGMDVEEIADELDMSSEEVQLYLDGDDDPEMDDPEDRSLMPWDSDEEDEPRNEEDENEEYALSGSAARRRARQQREMDSRRRDAKMEPFRGKRPGDKYRDEDEEDRYGPQGDEYDEVGIDGEQYDDTNDLSDVEAWPSDDEYDDEYDDDFGRMSAMMMGRQEDEEEYDDEDRDEDTSDRKYHDDEDGMADEYDDDEYSNGEYDDDEYDDDEYADEVQAGEWTISRIDGEDETENVGRDDEMDYGEADPDDMSYEEEDYEYAEDAEEPSKKDQARALYRAMKSGEYTRKDIINAFEKRLQLSPSSSTAYYERIAKEYGETEQQGQQDPMGGMGGMGGMGQAGMGGMGDEALSTQEEPEFQDPQEWEDPHRQGVIRTVKDAHLVFKRQADDGSFEELWLYKEGDKFQNELEIRRDILAGTDIPVNKTSSDDRSQRSETWAIGDVQYMQITGLPN